MGTELTISRKITIRHLAIAWALNDVKLEDSQIIMLVRYLYSDQFDSDITEIHNTSISGHEQNERFNDLITNKLTSKLN